jgi:hypothetical protein
MDSGKIKENELSPSSDYIAITDGEGNVVAILDLVKKVLHYAGRELPFFLVAGPEEKEYPSFYANAMVQALKNLKKGRGNRKDAD